jgi:hypothetical protein
VFRRLLSYLSVQEFRPAMDNPAPPSSRIGHNGGPPLADEPEHATTWGRFVWRKAHKKAWKTPPREIALRRLARAEALGMTYKEYTLEILERGRYL